MGYPDRSRIVRQFKITSTLSRSQLTGMISLGVEYEDEPGRTAVKRLTFRKPDLLPQPFP